MMRSTFSVCDSPETLRGIALPSYKNSLLLMHPTDMKILECEKNHLVLLRADGKKMIFRSSPCLSVTPSSVIFPALNLFRENLKHSVTVEVYDEFIDYAEKVILTFDRYKSFMKSINFRRYLQKKLEKLNLTEDLILSFFYLGYSCQCVVKKVTSSRDEIMNQKNISDDNLLLKESALDSSFICSTPKYSKVSSPLMPENSIKNINHRSESNSFKKFYVIHEDTKVIIENEKSKITLSSQVTFQDLCGLKEQIGTLKSLLNPVLNQNSGGNCRGTILIGAPGTGKSTAVEALGNEFHLPVIRLNDIPFTRNREEMKTQIQNLFKTAEDNAPSILFLDNIDSFCTNVDIMLDLRGKSETAHHLSTMIHQLLDSRSDIIIISAAHNVSDVDSCLRKPGLLETDIYFVTPSLADRKEILGKILSHTLNQEQISEIAENTHGYTGGDLKLFVSMASNCSHTLLLQGPPGTGKSLALDAFKKMNYIPEDNCIVWSKLYSMSDSEIRKYLNFVFEKAVQRAPSFIIMDEFNHLCPQKNKAKSIHQYVANILSQLIDALDDEVVIIAATNDSEYDETVLQTSRRVMEVIEFQIPSTSERVLILERLLAQRNHELTSEQIKECAEMAHGFTAKDLLSVAKDADLLLFSRSFENSGCDGGGMKQCDLKHIINLKKPTIVESDIKLQKVQWSDIGGMKDVKQKLKRLVEWPLKYPEIFSHFCETPAHGILMFGPPGCCKTMLAKALATECEMNFIAKNVSDLMNKYVGESERLIRDLFSLAKSKAPCIVFLDEIDAIGSERGSSCGDSGVGDRVVTTLLTEINGIEELHGVTIVAATNRPDVLDNALVRSGRISKYIYVPLPDAEAREEILKIGMRNRVISDDFDYKLLSAKTEGYSGAEIVNICNEAARQLMLEVLSKEKLFEVLQLPCIDSPVFQLHHFERALQCNPPRTDKKLIECCERFLCKGLL